MSLTKARVAGSLVAAFPVSGSENVGLHENRNRIGANNRRENSTEVSKLLIIATN